MGRYIVHKIGYAFLTLFGVVTVIFFLFNILPGDPAKMMLGQNQTEEQIAIVKKKYGFDKPVLTQYAYTSMIYCQFRFIPQKKKIIHIWQTTNIVRFRFLPSEI